uniref:WD_REPEATS_REGION domain-containing protein n=1 Tax=Trichobilharzia regenti TaxID=157069 RepID=A0AA85JDR0_TRIRE|nr:unnamed protein product [Trichobilharzia regenti]
MDKSSILKFVSMKLSRVRFVSEPEVRDNQLVVTGSWLEEVNRICLWQYSIGSDIVKRIIKPVSEKEDCTYAGVIGDCADEPRLLCSLIHKGSIQELKVYHPCRVIFSASSDGTLRLFQADDGAQPYLTQLTANDWMPIGQGVLCGNLSASLSCLALSPNGTRAYVSNDFGKLAAVDVNRIPGLHSPIPARYSKDPVFILGDNNCTVNALQCVDNSTLATVDQLGRLALWDLRTGSQDPQCKYIRPGGNQPLLCISQHPGQPHVLCAGGFSNSDSAAYIWDTRAKEYPLTSISFDGEIIWETAFHPRRPKYLYVATERAGLICFRSGHSWVYDNRSRRKLNSSSAFPNGTKTRSATSLDISDTLLICSHSVDILESFCCDASLF